MSLWLTSLFHDEEGATAVEYAVIAAVLAVALVTAFWALGGDLETFFGGITDSIDTTNPN
ncbi:MAG: Flp family type IVb pilin [Algiphilus sp.]|uniref:Flp family type IVb pilin n=1 Tax=Algiphilus sp. TaxID=1872431 RepID=UPI0032EB3416